MISVVVVNWNRRDLLRKCFLSLCRQTVAGFEVILVDNGSGDGSAEMAEQEFGNGVNFQLQMLRNGENRGFCEANNQGIALAKGELIALLNNDAEAEPGWLEGLASAFADRQVGMAASKIVVWEDPGRIDKVGHLIYPDGQNKGRGAGERDEGQYDRREEALWPDGCAAMYRKAMLDEIGGFDEDFFAYGDDAELGLRARIAGWDCVYIPEAVVRHHRGSTLGLGSARRLMLIERNRILLALKLFPPGLLMLNPWYTMVRYAAGAWAAFQGRGETKHYAGANGKLRMAQGLIWGIASALRLAPRILKKRREIGRFRKRSHREIRELLRRYRIPLAELTGQSI